MFRHVALDREHLEKSEALLKVCVHVCVVYMYVCICVCMCVCLCMCVTCTHTHTGGFRQPMFKLHSNKAETADTKRGGLGEWTRAG